MSSPHAAPAAASASRPEPGRDDGIAVRRLRRRAEFKAVARGPRWSSDAFTLQALRRAPGDRSEVGLGFTATRRLGGAVVRNRIRRRLKEAARRAFPDGALPGVDYVIVARPAAQTCAFTQLTTELTRALQGLRRKLQAPSSAVGPRASSASRSTPTGS